MPVPGLGTDRIFRKFHLKSYAVSIFISFFVNRSVSTDEPVATGFFICVNPRNPVFNHFPNIHEQPIVHLINIVAMNPLIRIVFALLFLSLVFIHSFAGNGSVRPVNHLTENSAVVIHNVDSFLSVSIVFSEIPSAEVERNLPSSPKESEEASSRTRICSCQILNLESSNYDHRHIAIFAEKANHGSSSDIRAAKNRIEKEKKQLKHMFYDKVNVVAEITAVGSCHSMYVQLKRGDRSLQIYEILNADIR